MIKGKHLFFILIIGFSTMISCTNNQNSEKELKVVDPNMNELFSIKNDNDEYAINDNEVDLYIRKDLNLPEAYSLDYVKFVFIPEKGTGTVVIQYLTEELHQYPIVFYISKQNINGTEVLGIRSGGKKYVCMPDIISESWCLACCEATISNDSGSADCLCDPPVYNDNSCNSVSTDGCKWTEVKDHSGGGN